MALCDYILCNDCGCKLLYDGSEENREWYKERFGKELVMHCPDCEPKPAPQPQPLTVPQGYRLVPVEPTSSMLLKADGLTCIDFKALGEEGAFSFDELTAIYRAMLAAAPQAPAVQPTEQISSAWLAGYYHAGYTHDRAYAEEQAAKYAKDAIHGIGSCTQAAEKCTRQDSHVQKTEEIKHEGEQ